LSGPTYLEATVVGALQGVTELFPISSLGHSILIPALIGGSWARDLSMTGTASAYLTFLVALHVATALGIMAYFWRDWVRVIGGLISAIAHRRVDSPDERLAVLLVVGTIPVGIAGLLLDEPLREYLGKPVPASAFLLLNGFVLLCVELLRRGDGRGRHAAGPALEYSPDGRPLPPDIASDRRLARLGFGTALWVGGAQAFALLPGISRSGVSMSAGLLRGLRHEDAARFAFLFATPVILAAGVLKLPELAEPANRGVVGPAILGSIVAAVGSFLSVRFLTRYFETRTLIPFAIYCVLAGAAALAYFSL
jgi:undecaprenyl-diphosphatase